MKKILFFLPVIIVFIFSGCITPTEEAKNNSSIQKTIAQFHSDLEKPGLTTLEQAIIREQIAIYKSHISHAEMIRYITDHVSADPEDPFNSFYLYRVAMTFQEKGFHDIAYQYYFRLYSHYPDVQWQNRSIHYLSLNQLIQITTDGVQKINFLQALLNKYPEQIDRGTVYFELAKAFEAIGEYNQAIGAYESFLRFPQTQIPGYPGVHQQIREKVAFHRSNKNWLRPSLDTLVSQMKTTLATKNGRALLDLQAKTNFFSVSWHQDRFDVNARPDFNLLSFLYGDTRIQFARDVEIRANGNEALLRTWGWSPRIPTWFLYFRKVDYPANPAIHGSWEWAGIYFGESL